jgi:TIR domain
MRESYPTMMKPLNTPRVFVSHSHEDNDYCRALVLGLRQSGLAVWYDEHNLGWGQLRQTIDRELQDCQHFVAILSPAAVASDWVNMEIDAALAQWRRKHLQMFLLVVAHPCNIPLTLEGFKRLEDPRGGGVAVEEAIRRVTQTVREVEGSPSPPQLPPMAARPPIASAQHYGVGPSGPPASPPVPNQAPYPSRPYYPATPSQGDPYQQPYSVVQPYRQTPVPPKANPAPAVTALVLGAASLLTAFLYIFGLPIPIAGLIFGFIGRRSATYRKIAIVGIVLCIVGLLLNIVLTVLAIIAASTFNMPTSS